MPQQPDKVPGLKQQYSHARAELVVRGVHMGLPWALFIVLTVFGNVLHLVSSHDPAVGRYLWLTTTLVLATGVGVAAWDYHLRRHRMTVAGQLVGPVTALSASVMTATFLQAGYSVPLVLLWLFGGIGGCFGWDAWLHHAARHDPALAFPLLTERAGLGRARRTARDRKAAPAAPAAAPRRGNAPVRGSIAWPPGEVTPEDAARRAANLEGAGHLPPGSFSLTPSEQDGAMSHYVISDPLALERSDPWPGPHAPGQDMSVPFRLGTWQTGEVALVPMLPLFLTRGMGQTGSAKTTGWQYCQLGEGVTRQGYAALVMDVSKGSQFFGAWSPALHRFESGPDGALRLLRGLNRAVKARAEYLGRKHLAEWQDGCGLSFLDVYMAECPDIIALLETARSRFAGAAMTMPDWLSSVKNGRSAGVKWNLDLQLTLASEMPTVAQGQMSHLCLGVADRDQARFGLSARQLDAGCRPELWGKKRPGTAYWDVPTLPDEYATLPMRFYNWGEQPVRAAFDYAADWPAAARPLDEVTGEALEAEPAPPASHALPGPGGTLAGSRPEPREAVRGRGNVRPLFGVKSRRPDPQEEAEKAEQVVLSHLAGKYGRGEKVFAFNDLTKEGLWGGVGDGPGGKTNRSRSWGYAAIDSMTTMGYLEPAPGARKRWRILPAVLEAVRPGETEEG